MTRKHFEAIAAIIKAQVDLIPDFGAAGFDDGFFTGQREALELVAKDFSEKFEEFNPLMNKARFLTACGF